MFFVLLFSFILLIDKVNTKLWLKFSTLPVSDTTYVLDTTSHLVYLFSRINSPLSVASFLIANPEISLRNDLDIHTHQGYDQPPSTAGGIPPHPTIRLLLRPELQPFPSTIARQLS